MALRVLIVDDSRDDAELAELALRDGGFAVESRVLHRPAQLGPTLVEFAPHLVLCDLNLPAFSFDGALAVVREHDPALPVVCVTGAPPRVAPAADRVVLKDRLDTLPGVVRGLLER